MLTWGIFSQLLCLMYKPFKNCQWRDEHTKAGSSCKLTVGSIPSADLQIPKLNQETYSQSRQFYFSTKHSKLNYVHYLCIITGEKKSVLN